MPGKLDLYNEQFCSKKAIAGAKEKVCYSQDHYKRKLYNKVLLHEDLRNQLASERILYLGLHLNQHLLLQVSSSQFKQPRLATGSDEINVDKLRINKHAILLEVESKVRLYGRLIILKIITGHTLVSASLASFSLISWGIL